jgi:hypothetical protein
MHLTFLKKRTVTKKYNRTYYTLKFEYLTNHFERIVIHFVIYTHQAIKYKKVKIRSLLKGVLFSFKIAWFLNDRYLICKRSDEL